jgi:trehalose 6-phosphate phosphatase
MMAGFAASDVVVAFDYDGTLAPINPAPGRVRMRDTTRRLLRSVAGRYPCAVISGREYVDIERRLKGVPLQGVFGNHGIEPLWADPAGAALVTDWLATLARRLGGCRGVWLEDKHQSLAIHYRHARDPAATRRIIARAIAGLKEVRAIDGRASVNLIPRRGPNKGRALKHICRVEGCARAIYVGDDGTDEDAFGALRPDRLISIRVGRNEQSLASFTLRSQRDLDALLRLLIALRTPAPDRR